MLARQRAQRVLETLAPSNERSRSVRMNTYKSSIIFAFVIVVVASVPGVSQTSDRTVGTVFSQKSGPPIARHNPD